MGVPIDIHGDRAAREMESNRKNPAQIEIVFAGILIRPIRIADTRVLTEDDGADAGREYLTLEGREGADAAEEIGPFRHGAKITSIGVEATAVIIAEADMQEGSWSHSVVSLFDGGKPGRKIDGFGRVRG